MRRSRRKCLGAQKLRCAPASFADIVGFRFSPSISRQPLSAGEPTCALGAEFLPGACLIFRHVFGSKRVGPSAVHAAIDEDLGTGIPECATEGNTLCRVPLHP